MTNPLMHGSREMSPLTTTDRTPAEVRKYFDDDPYSDYALIQLEPGDMTRYTLHIVRFELWFGITYIQSGAPVATVWLPSWSRDVNPEDLISLSANEWTRTFLAWWLTKFLMGGER